MDIGTTMNIVGANLGINPLYLLAITIWSLSWKGVALWKSAQLEHKKWFVALVIINTLGILEIIYIFFVAKKYEVEIIKENQ